MKLSFAPVLLAASLLASAAPALADAWRLGPLEVGGAWSRPAARGQNGVGYLTLTNRGKAPVVLAGVETPAAARAELHQSVMTGSVMSMKPVVGGLTVPAGGKAELGPAGVHIMLVALKQKLDLGQKIPATLVFKDGSRLKIELSVQARADSTANMQGM